MNCDEGMRQILRKYGGAISGWLLGAESNTLVCWMSLAKLRIFNNRWRHLSNLKIPAKKISVMCDWHLLPRIQLQWTFSLLWYLICRCLKLQKSVFLQLLITKVGFMLGPALDCFLCFLPKILVSPDWSLPRLMRQWMEPVTAHKWERLQLIGLKSFHQYDDGRPIFQRQFTAYFSIYKVGINQGAY